MSEDKKRKNLGMGLDALLGEENEDYAELDKVRNTKDVAIDFLQPGKYQPRHNFDEKNIKDLALSIKEKGILQPILVRRQPDDPNYYEIIAGERRWQAARQAGLIEVPIIIKDFTDKEALEVALIENLQRQDLNALEEAEGYSRLMEEFENTQENLAKALGKSRSHVTNMMRLLGLPNPVKQLLENGDLTAGHARALLSADDSVTLAEEIVKKGLNVRQTEKLVKSGIVKKTEKKIKEKDPDTVALENDLSNLLGLKVSINFHGKGGKISFQYETLEQLDDILQRLNTTVSHENETDVEEIEKVSDEKEPIEDWEIALAPDELPEVEKKHEKEENGKDIDDKDWTNALSPHVPKEEQPIENEETSDVTTDNEQAVAIEPDIPEKSSEKNIEETPEEASEEGDETLLMETGFEEVSEEKIEEIPEDSVKEESIEEILEDSTENETPEE